MENKYTKHSAGPWKAVREMEQFDGSTYIDPMDDEDRAEFEKRNYVRVVDQNNQNIVTNHDLFEFDNKYDAFLISAAPDLLEALTLMLEHEGERGVNGIGLEYDSDNLERAKELAIKAIKKAKGE